jgi:hypothetical protein
MLTGLPRATCTDFQAALDPLCHQVIEIPPTMPVVIEQWMHRLVYPCCSTSTCAPLPADVDVSCYGPRLSSLIALPTSSIRHRGKRMPRRIRQSGSTLRKLIRSLAAAGVAAGWQAKGQDWLPLRPP